MKSMAFGLFLFFGLFVAGLFAERVQFVDIKGNTKDSKVIKIKAEMLEGSFSKDYKIFDPYTKKDTTYRGVEFRDFLKTYSAPDTKKAKLVAIDGYTAEFSSQEWEKASLVLAYKDDGKFMDLKNYGPMKIIIPDYDKSKLDDKSNFIKWIWMIRTIELSK